MAAKKGTNIYDFVDDGTVFTYDRLAEDVLYHLYSEFGVQKRLIPPARCSENYYKKETTICFVSRQCKVVQIMLRSILFYSFMDSNVVKRIGNDITNLYQILSEHFDAMTYFLARKMTSYTTIDKFHSSFALIVELTLFCIMKDKPKVIKKTAKTWVSFFEKNLKKEFEYDGGISTVLGMAEKKCYMDSFLFTFISIHCVPYKGQKLSNMYFQDLQNSTVMGVKVENIMCTSKSDRHLDVMSEELEKSSEEKQFDPLRSVPVHDRLGVPLHEEVLKQSFDPKLLALRAEATSKETCKAAAKAISALSMKEERKQTRKLRLSKASTLKHKCSVTKVEASNPAGTKEQESKTCDREPISHASRNKLKKLVPHVLHEPSQEDLANLKYLFQNTPQAETASMDTSEAAAKPISALSLKEERKKTIKLRLSKASMLKHKQSVTEGEDSSSVGTKKPETNTWEPIDNELNAYLRYLLRQSPEPSEPSRECVENLQSVPKNTTDNYSILGARSETRMSSKKR